MLIQLLYASACIYRNVTLDIEWVYQHWDYTLEKNHGWHLNMEVWKIMFLFNWVIVRFHVNFPGCSQQMQQNSHGISPLFFLGAPVFSSQPSLNKRMDTKNNLQRTSFFFTMPFLVPIQCGFKSWRGCTDRCHVNQSRLKCKKSVISINGSAHYIYKWLYTCLCI